jgi:nucleoside-diphosphate-sugar epimerase
MDLSDGLDGLAPVDAIIHAAAHTHLIPDSTAQDYIRSNVLGALNLAEYAKRVGAAALINLSTISIYGQVRVSQLDEETPLEGPEMYGLSKYTAEMIFKEHAVDFPSVSLRLPGVVGDGYFTPWVGQLLTKAGAGLPLSIVNADSMFNNVVDLQELHRLVSWLLERGLSGGNVCNVASSKPLTIRAVAELVKEGLDSASPVIERPSDRQPFTISIEKLKHTFGFEPTPTRAVIQRYVARNRPVLSAQGAGLTDP